MRGLVILFFLALVPSAFAAPTGDPNATSFQQYNPDIDKYAFAKSYIASLDYYGRLDRRLKAEKAVADKFTEDLKVVQTMIDDRMLDNTELRVAKNYLLKYATAANMLIRKVAYDTAVAYESNILLSSKERRLWQAYLGFKKTGRPKDLDEAGFKAQLERFAHDRKVAAMAVLDAVVMFKKVLLSAKDCADENCQALALTQVERDKLAQKMDVFAGDNMAWGIKAGQGTFEAAVASVREVLEDPLFLSRK